ncbi:putative gustatory receptor 28b [Aphis craccivora]|uniref:Putative gustatory receptor 28b n=1 Tax=Aphis craccivora TaxID=307492 RepID=A0A6G0YNY8_APHCR|nr:putative gustatory receptor 28b [Aphis craccivora]
MRCGRFGRRAAVSVALAAMAVMCVFNFVLTPYFECILDGDSCDEHVSFMAGVYARSVSVTCLVAVAVAWLEHRGAVATYLERKELHDAYKTPATADAVDGRPRYVGHATFGAAVFYTSMALIVPINAFRLYRFVSDDRPVAVIVYFSLMYSQNLYACLYETHFVRLFYALYTRFADLNSEMEAIGEWIVDGRVAREEPPTGRHGAGWIPCDGDDDGRPSHLYCSAATGQPLVDAVERLRFRHRLIREAVDALKPAFALPIGLSLCNLCVMALFDVYYHLKNSVDQPAGDLATMYIFLWLGQYTFRFFVVTMTVDATVKQAS